MAKSNTKIIYEKKEDILYLSKGKAAKASIEVGDFIIDIDFEGFVSAIEILNAGENLNISSEILEKINKLNNLDIDPLSIDGLKKVEVGITPGIMMLLDNCTGIVMVTTRSQTFSIMRGKEKVQDVRPNAHDLIQDMVNNLDIEVLMVKVTGNFEEMYYAGLFFKKDNKILNLDARPSDALSIATRLSVPVYVDEKLFEKQKQKVC